MTRARSVGASKTPRRRGATDGPGARLSRAAVDVFLPMRRFENKAERERVRSDVYKRVQGSFQNLGRYQKVRVITSSGFDLGIASLNLKDG
jgi:hypothetical protein